MFMMVCMTFAMLLPAMPVGAGYGNGERSEMVFYTGDGPSLTDFANNSVGAEANWGREYNNGVYQVIPANSLGQQSKTVISGRAGYPTVELNEAGNPGAGLPAQPDEMVQEKIALPDGLGSLGWEGYLWDGWYIDADAPDIDLEPHMTLEDESNRWLADQKVSELEPVFPGQKREFLAKWNPDPAKWYDLVVEYELLKEGQPGFTFAKPAASHHAEDDLDISGRSIPGYDIQLMDSRFSPMKARRFNEFSGAGSGRALDPQGNFWMFGNLTTRMPNDDLTVTYVYEKNSQQFAYRVRHLVIDGDGRVVTELSDSTEMKEVQEVITAQSRETDPAAASAYLFQGCELIYSETETHTKNEDTDQDGTIDQIIGAVISSKLTDRGVYTMGEFAGAPNDGGFFNHAGNFSGIMPNQDITLNYYYKQNPALIGELRYAVSDSGRYGTLTGDSSPTRLPFGTEVSVDANGRLTASDGSPLMNGTDLQSDPPVMVTGRFSLAPENYCRFDGWYKTDEHGNKTSGKLTGFTFDASMTITAFFTEDPARWIDVEFAAGTGGHIRGNTAFHVPAGTRWDGTIDPLTNDRAPAWLAEPSVILPNVHPESDEYIFEGWYDGAVLVQRPAADWQAGDNRVAAPELLLEEAAYTAIFRLKDSGSQIPDPTYRLETIGGTIVRVGETLVDSPVHTGIRVGDEPVRVEITAPLKSGYRFDRWDVLIGGPLPGFNPNEQNAGFTMPKQDVVLTALYQPDRPATPGNAQVDYWVNPEAKGQIAPDLSGAGQDDFKTAVITDDDRNLLNSGSQIRYQVRLNKRSPKASESNAAMQERDCWPDAFTAAWALDIDLWRYVDGSKSPVTQYPAESFDVIALIDGPDRHYMDYQLWEISPDGTIAEVEMVPDPDEDSGGSGLFRFKAKVNAVYVFTYSATRLVTIENTKDASDGAAVKVRKGSSLAETQDWHPAAAEYVDDAGKRWIYQGLSRKKNVYAEYDVNSPVNKDITIYALYREQKTEPDPDPKPEPEVKPPGGGDTGGNTGSGNTGSGNTSGSGRRPVYRNGIDGHWELIDAENHKWIFVLNDGRRISGTWAYLSYIYEGQERLECYHFADDGIMDSGWFRDTDGTWYYLSTLHDGWFGHLVKGWHHDREDGHRYYLDPVSGAMWTGWGQVGGPWYYFNPTTPVWTWNYNEAARRWEYLGNDAYRPYGAVYENEVTPDGYRVDADGVWVKE